MASFFIKPFLKMFIHFLRERERERESGEGQREGDTESEAVFWL